MTKRVSSVITPTLLSIHATDERKNHKSIALACKSKREREKGQRKTTDWVSDREKLEQSEETLEMELFLILSKGPIFFL